MDERVSTPVCYRHPDRPTRLSCSECGRPICVECTHDAAVGQKCPEHARNEGRHRIVDARRSTGRFGGLDGAPFSKWTIYVTVAIYAIGFLVPDIADWMAGTRVRGGIIPDGHLEHNNAALADGEVWRMFTHALLHSRDSPMHILFNMYLLYIFGPVLERRVGSLPFAGLYIASAGAGSAAAFILGPPQMTAVGASGAVFGLFGAWLFASWRMRSTVQGRAQFNQLAVLLAINLALPLFIPLIAWEAHVGGLIGGGLIAWGWSTWAVGTNNPESRRVAVAMAVLALTVVIVLVG